MIYIKTYEGLLDLFKRKPKETDPKKIEINNLCKLYNIKNYVINDDYTIDVDDNVDISNKGLDKIPIKFNRVTGYFSCVGNNLKNLENSPRWVDRNFMCQYQYDNSLVSLKGAPDYVGYRFDCYNNESLYSLEYLPNSIGASLDIRNTGIHSFDDIHDSIDSIILNDTPIFKIARCFLTSQELRTGKINHETIDLFKSYDPIRPSEGGARPILYMSRFISFLEYINRDKIVKLFNAFYNNENCYELKKNTKNFNVILDAYQDIQKYYFIQ